MYLSRKREPPNCMVRPNGSEPVIVAAPKVVGYIRVSSEDQVREGVSLDVQATRIAAFCEAKGWQLVRVIRDEGKSAKDVKRPGLQEILNVLPKEARGWDGLVVVKLDRLTRSVRDLGYLTDAFRKARVAFTSIQESVDTSSAAGELFFNLVAAVSQWERRAIGERTEGAMAHLRSQGRRGSRHGPFGYRFQATRKKSPTGKPIYRVVPDPQEQQVRRIILQLAASRTLRALSAELATEASGAARGSRSARPHSTGSFPREPLGTANRPPRRPSGRPLRASAGGETLWYAGDR